MTDRHPTYTEAEMAGLHGTVSQSDSE